MLLTGISKVKLGFILTLILVELHKRSQCVQGKLLHYRVQLVVPLCRKKQSLVAYITEGMAEKLYRVLLDTGDMTSLQRALAI